MPETRCFNSGGHFGHSKKGDFDADEAHKNQSNEGDVFSAPLGTLKNGRLVFASGVQGLELEADPSMPFLYQARFKRYVPRLSVQKNILTLEYRHLSIVDQLVDLSKWPTHISLNGSIPWEFEFRGGVSHLNADLPELRLRSLDILGGATHIRLRLSRPSGTTFIYVSGGINRGAIRVPSTAAIRAAINGGSTNLLFEDQRFQAIAGETRLESPDFPSATGRYDICVAGGTSDFTIDRKG